MRSCIFVLLGAGLLSAALPASAQSAAPGVTQSAAPPANAHRSEEEKLRDCRKKAAAQQLSNEAKTSAIAACMKAVSPP